MLKEFKEFISRGSVLDLAVGVIIGGAFTSIITTLTTNVITPLINLVISFIIPNSKNMEDATKGMFFKVNGIKFDYGSVISAIITFLITAFVLFMIIKTVNKANQIVPKKEEVVADEEEPETSEAILNDIRDLLKAQQENTKNTPDN
ncbi:MULTISPECIES: large conductance mechanosensitive channel protein MscL [Vagococcus]|uniref:Large-conductance mechanosensitive channel n=1 Tax=Vagococcus fluvialis bH819 TaxID=1255619 RepID=A0A1X6WLA4_9ENTE|nr:MULTISPECIES: large conductance mechanosensitive channel protein MscL [Vagococcus]SLM85022.1 Large-conductance mechanosensitive channel [Vagococcus fluvialis bH819]HCM88562.1 large conductance mechanosensitive channel protein MscL [Vagococcus sp.]